MMQDDEVVVTMVDSNLQREQITPSEKAYAYKMKYDAIKKKAGRKNCGQVDHNTGKRSIDVIGELCGDSAKQVQRYIKMTESEAEGILGEIKQKEADRVVFKNEQLYQILSINLFLWKGSVRGRENQP